MKPNKDTAGNPINYTDPTGHKAANLEKEFRLPKAKAKDTLEVKIKKNTVNITWKAQFKIATPCLELFDGVKYQNNFVAGVQKKWSGNYSVRGHRIRVKTKVKKVQNANAKVIFHLKLGVSNASVLSKKDGVIRMYVGDNRKGTPKVPYSPEEYRITSAHEFGHILGLDDGYSNPKTANIRSIMCSSWSTGFATNLDIEKALRAYKTNKIQGWL